VNPLSPDLWVHIIRAVEVEGMSRRPLAERFGVAASPAVELLEQRAGMKRNAGARRAPCPGKATGTYDGIGGSEDRTKRPIKPLIREV